MGMWQGNGVVVIAAVACLALASCSSFDEHESGVATQSPVVDIQLAPADTRWVSGPAGLSYPVSEIAGPTSMSGEVPAGFADSPQGAVIAAIVAQVFMAGAGDQVWPLVAQTLIEPGIGRDQWSQARALVSVTSSVENPPRFRGFRISDFTGSSAVVTLAVTYPNGTLAAYPVQVSRSLGDWRVVLPPQDEAPDLQEISEETLTSSFTAFGPEEG